MQPQILVEIWMKHLKRNRKIIAYTHTQSYSSRCVQLECEFISVSTIYAKLNEQAPFSFSFQLRNIPYIPLYYTAFIFKCAIIFNKPLGISFTIEHSAFAEIATGNRAIKVVNYSIWWCNKKRSQIEKKTTNMYSARKYTCELCVKCYISKARNASKLWGFANASSSTLHLLWA